MTTSLDLGTSKSFPTSFPDDPRNSTLDSCAIASCAIASPGADRRTTVVLPPRCCFSVVLRCGATCIRRLCAGVRGRAGENHANVVSRFLNPELK
jgi:hypothetical protein